MLALPFVLFALATCWSHAAAMNAAAGKHAWYSSYYSPGLPATRATDGNTDATFNPNQPGCSHNDDDIENPYLIVDLCNVYEIESVEMWVRGHPGILGRDVDLEIRIGNDVMIENNPVCAKFSGEVARQVSAACDMPLTGRYLSVQRMAPGPAYMQVCEIMANTATEDDMGCMMDKEMNVAEGKEAMVSSEYSSSTLGDKAVDGSTAPTFDSNAHCSHTNAEDNPYVVVDLCASYTISSIELWVRGHSGIRNRDFDLEVRIGDDMDFSKNPLCAFFPGEVSRSVTAMCGLMGRYVSVQRRLSVMEAMHVCEIKAFTADAEKPCADAVTEPPPVDVCKLPKDMGTGDESLNRYYFKNSMCKCMKFSYCGEGGNMNNFETKEDCENRCLPEVPNECMEKKDAGHCDDSTTKSGKMTKYFYNNKKGKCKSFKYSGCGGSGNMFDSKIECQDYCMPKCSDDTEVMKDMEDMDDMDF